MPGEQRNSQADDIYASMTQELTGIADHLLASSQFDPRQVDMAAMLFRTLSELKGLDSAFRRRIRQQFATACLYQTGQPTGAIEEFERLVKEHDDADVDVVPYAMSLLHLAHLDLRHGAPTSQTWDRTVTAEELLGANNQTHPFGWAKFLKGVIELQRGETAEATILISRGLTLMEQSQLGRVEQQTPVARIAVGAGITT